MARVRIEAFIGERNPAVFGSNVRRSREGLGWTRQRLCREAGISPQTLAKVEAGGGCTPGVERKIAAATGSVFGRMWEPQELPRSMLRTPASDRWYFTSHADGERFRRAQTLLNEDEPIRFDPDAIQDPSERRRMGLAGRAAGFVRIATGHLRAGTVISSVLEIYGRIDADLPGGRLAYFHVQRGTILTHLGEETYEVGEGDILLAETAVPTWLEPAVPVGLEALPPLVLFVDLQPRLNPVP